MNLLRSCVISEVYLVQTLGIRSGKSVTLKLGSSKFLFTVFYENEIVNYVFKVYCTTLSLSLVLIESLLRSEE